MLEVHPVELNFAVAVDIANAAPQSSLEPRNTKKIFLK
jgi:hypothetical protein